MSTSTLHYKSFGSGQPFIILHGLFGMLDNWQSFAKKLQDTHQVILVDQRNHGRSFQSEEFNYKVLAQDVIKVMDELELESAVVLGHSMGGKTALQLTHDFPDRISQLIMVDIGLKQYPRGHDAIFDAVLGLDLSEVSTRKEADELLGNSIKNMAIRQFLLKNLHRRTEGGYEWKANFQVLYEQYDNVIAAVVVTNIVKQPTLCIRGTQSGYVSDDDIKDMNDHFAKFQVVDMNAGHWVHAERPTELLEVLRNFLT